MSAPARFKQEDLARAVRGVKKAGFRIGRIEIDPTGRIVILPESTATERGVSNEWDADLP